MPWGCRSPSRSCRRRRQRIPTVLHDFNARHSSPFSSIIRTYHAGTCDNLHYIAMEYLEGETLEEYLADKSKLDPTEAVGIIGQALRGLQHLHEKGIVHRDLKPGNLMLVSVPASPGSAG